MPQIDNPDSLGQTLAGRIKTLEDRLSELSAAPLGKVRFATGWAPTLAPVISSTPQACSATIAVPALATSCGYSAFAMGGGYNTTAVADYLQVTVTVTYGAYTRFTYQAQNQIAPGYEGNVTVPMVDTFSFPPGGGTLTLTASIQNGTSGPWTNTTYNAIFPEGLFVFQY